MFNAVDTACHEQGRRPSRMEGVEGWIRLEKEQGLAKNFNAEDAKGAEDLVEES